MKLFKFFKDQKGFTLIELLVVIGVLGILATGLLATIDPLEQFRKGTDSNSKTTSLELSSALIRYYAVHGTFPWDTTANGGAGCGTGLAQPGSWNAPVQVSLIGGNSTFNTGTPGCLAQLVTEGELKSTFPTQYSVLSKLWVVDTTVGTTKSVAVCFNPDSKSESNKSESKYAYIGAGAAGPSVPLAATCTPATDNNCYQCSQ